MADANDFICQDCGEDFTNDDAEDLVDEDEEANEGEGSTFQDFDSNWAMGIAEQLRNDDNNKKE